MAENPIKQKLDLISISIMVDGSEIPGTYMVQEVEVKSEVNKIPVATVTLLDGNYAKMDFPISASDTFKPGKKLKITLGYHQDEKPTFEGVIVGSSIRIPEDRNNKLPTMVVKCVGNAQKMAVERKNRYFAEVKDSDVMSQIIGDHGLSADVASTSVKHERLIQFQSSDWDMLLTRADANAMIVVVEDDKIKVKEPETSNDVVTLDMGGNIVSLELDVDARFQVPKVTTEGWDYAQNTITHSEGVEPTPPKTGNFTGSELAKVLAAKDYRMHSVTPATADELKNWANSKYMRSRYSMVRGKIVFQGLASAKIDTTVELKGLGTRFTGSAYCSGVAHKIKDNIWQTEITIGLPPLMYAETQKDIDFPSASGLLPSVQGLQIGIVKQIHDDPEGQTRIMVDIPMIKESGDAVWARQAAYYATKGAGNFFIPEVGDEVILGFMNNDPRFPIIMGSVYSESKHAPAYTPDAPNTIKAITTNSKMKIEFEDVKRIITIWTPNKNFIEINDEKQSITIMDETKNKMVMDPKGITWDTPKDFKLTATGKIEIKAQQTISMEATQDFSIKGLNVKSEASVGNTMKGVQAEVSGSAMTTIKGGMVQIN
jgi:Rhs element Vgr protein